MNAISPACVKFFVCTEFILFVRDEQFYHSSVESQGWGLTAPLQYEPHMVVLEVQMSNSHFATAFSMQSCAESAYQPYADEYH